MLLRLTNIKVLHLTKNEGVNQQYEIFEMLCNKIYKQCKIRQTRWSIYDNNVDRDRLFKFSFHDNFLPDIPEVIKNFSKMENFVKKVANNLHEQGPWRYFTMDVDIANKLFPFSFYNCISEFYKMFWNDNTENDEYCTLPLPTFDLNKDVNKIMYS